jgi:hypothetical protein
MQICCVVDGSERDKLELHQVAVFGHVTLCDMQILPNGRWENQI